MWNEKLSKGGSMNSEDAVVQVAKAEQDKETKKKVENAKEFLDSYIKSFTQMAFTKQEKETALAIVNGLFERTVTWRGELEMELGIYKGAGIGH
jgi:hypothetical protein